MTGRRKRSQFTPEVKAEALRIALEHGANVASDRLGINAATIRSWVARAGGPDGERTAQVEAAELEAKPPEAMGVAEWVDLQRQTEARYRRTLASGSPSESRWYAISLAVITDKLKAAREADRVERPPIDSPDRTHAAAVLDSIVARTVGQLAFADVDRLRVEVEKERRQLGKHRRRLRMLLDEMLIRRRGERSQFQGVTEASIPEPWDHFDFEEAIRIDTVRPSPPVRPSPYVRYSLEPEVATSVATPVPSREAQEPVEPAEVAVVTSIERARRRSSWGRRSVQQQFLTAQGVDGSTFRPPGV